VAGTAPGGITDTLARVSADGLSAQFGRQVAWEQVVKASGVELD
jgi:tripartite-type tricarboxylate transporter receptor subunit TctC